MKTTEVLTEDQMESTRQQFLEVGKVIGRLEQVAERLESVIDDWDESCEENKDA